MTLESNKSLLLNERSLAIREKALGMEHPDVATTLNNMAMTYEDQGNYQEADRFYRRSLKIKEKVLGNDHPSTRSGRQNYEFFLDRVHNG